MATVLVVDDHEDLADLLARTLRAMGHAVGAGNFASRRGPRQYIPGRDSNGSRLLKLDP
jgi:CheY-like chemotaxis protein